MENIYLVLGTIVFWLFAFILLIAILYSLIVLIKMFQLVVKSQNWYNFYIENHTIPTDVLIEKYRTPWVVAKRDNKKYILLYRLRNIKKAKSNV